MLTMKKMWLLIPIFAGVMIGLMGGLILPVEQREKLSRPLAACIAQQLERMPDE